jgi:hypothetical protein
MTDSAAGDDMSSGPGFTPLQRPRFAVPGQLIILTVALLWGTNPPALRYLYASDGTTSQPTMQYPDDVPQECTCRTG